MRYVELVHQVMREARDDPAALFRILHEDARWESGAEDILDGPDVYRGPAGVQEFFRRWVGTFDDWDYELGEVIDAGDAVVFHLHQTGRGKGSGVPVSDDVWQVWRFRGGKLIRRTRHPDRSSALQAAGLQD